MIKCSRYVLSLALAATSVDASIDFTPDTGERVLDGIKFPQLIFQEGSRKITYEQPRGWTYSADSSRITFTPTNFSQAETAMEQSPLEKPQNFDEETMKALQEKVLTGAGPASQNIAIVSTEKNPVLLNGHETFEVIIGYQVSGVAFQRSVLFLNFPDMQLRFRVTARKQDFEKVHKAFRSSLTSFQGLR